jgi:hypothetical protein
MVIQIRKKSMRLRKNKKMPKKRLDLKFAVVCHKSLVIHLAL